MSPNLRKYGPSGAAILYFLFDFPAYPLVLTNVTYREFVGLKIAGVLLGAILARKFTAGTLGSRLIPKRRTLRAWIEFFAPIVVALVWLLVVEKYYELYRDAEDHFSLIRALFFIASFLAGVIILWAIPAIDALKGVTAQEKSKEKNGEKEKDDKKPPEPGDDTPGLLQVPKTPS